MTYQQAEELKDILLRDFIFREQQPKRMYTFNRPSNNYLYDSLKDDIYDFVNGVGIVVNGMDDYAVKIYTEGSLPVNGLSNYFGLNKDRFIVDNIGPITVLGDHCCGGDAIKTADGARGTLGCLVKDSAGKKYALSNYHVLTNYGNLRHGERVLYERRPNQEGESHSGVLGWLRKYEIVKHGNTENLVDCGIVELQNQEVIKNNIPGVPELKGPGKHTDKMEIVKRGQKTGVTTGYVSAINSSIKVDYGNGIFRKHIANFENQFEIKSHPIHPPFSKTGDSGSIAIDNQSGNVVGLIFAGTPDGTAFANPINSVLETLSVQIL